MSRRSRIGRRRAIGLAEGAVVERDAGVEFPRLYGIPPGRKRNKRGVSILYDQATRTHFKVR